MDNTISITVPADDLDAVRAARSFFEHIETSRKYRRNVADATPDDMAELDRVKERFVEGAGKALDDAMHGAAQPDARAAFEASGPSKDYDDMAELDAAHSEAPEGVELDADGLPWDHRIHSSSKKKKQDGKWKQRRNVPDEERAAVEAELRQLMAAPSPGTEAPTPETPAPEAPTSDAPAPATTAPEAPAPSPEAPAPEAPAPEAPAPEAPAPTTTSVTDFPGFLKAVGENVAARRITWDKVNEICNRHGVPQSALLASRTDLIPAVWADVERELGAAHG